MVDGSVVGVSSVSGWGVLVSSGADGRRPGCDGALRARLDGVVVVPDGTTGPAAPTRLDYLINGLRRVPDDATVIALLEDDALALQGVDALGAMLDRLSEGLAGVVCAVPVTDALKRVEGDRVVGGVDRSGLFMPTTPQVLRRDALDAALLASPARHAGDPATLLVRCGHPIGVLWGARAEETHPPLSSAGGDR